MSVRSNKLRMPVYAALFAALCCVSTLCIAIPLPYGYVNVGDIFVLLAGFFLGPMVGGVAAGLGAALSDLFLGYYVYVPATAVIKFALALLSAGFYRGISRLCRSKTQRMACRAFSCLIGECIMVLGYFLYETLLYGWGAACLGVVGNALQGGVCLIGAQILVAALSAIPTIKRIFPKFDE